MSRWARERKDAERTLERPEIEALLDASRAASEPIDLDTALDAILDAALRLLDADEGSIQLVDPASQELWIAAARGIPEQLMRSTRVPVGHGVSGRVAQAGTPLLLTSAVDVQRFSGFIAKERRIHGAICVPLRARGAVIGVLNFDLMKPGRTFSDHDLNLATLFGDNAAYAIVARQLLDRAERQAVEIDALRTASVSLTTTLDLETLADEVLTRALELTGSGAGLICIAGPGGKPVTLARYRGLPRDEVRATLATPEFREIMATGTPQLVRGPWESTPFAPLGAILGKQDLMIVPAVPAEDENSGVLAVALKGGPMSSGIRLLRTFAPEAALALGNAILHRRIATKEQELQTIVDSVSMPIVLVDRSARFRLINPAAAQTFRLTPEFEAGQPITGKLGEELEEMLGATEEVMGREVVLGIGGLPRAYRASVTSVRWGGTGGGRVLVLDDVTAEREVEQRKADFLAVIGHELRTPLTAIRGFTSTVIRNGDKLDAQTRSEALNRVMAQSERLERLIEDLLFVSRIERGRPPLHLSWDDLAEVCASVVSEFRRRDPDRPILLDTSRPEVPLRMDRIKVEQVLFHVLDNALKYSEPRTQVRVAIEQHEDHIELSVTDRGIGIYSGDIPRLFRPFGQLDASSTRRHGGTGVGLHVCKTLVDAFGGRIWAESVLGKGSTFSFSVPRNPPDDEVSLPS